MSVHGSRWTKEEEQLLLVELRDGHKISEIAEHHGRTVGGITARQKVIATKMLEEGKPMAQVCKTTRLTEDIIRQSQTQKKETELEVLKDIRAILLRVEKRFPQ
jgi:predicted transposase YdaD